MRLRLLIVSIACLTAIVCSTASAAESKAAVNTHPPKARTLRVERGWRSYFREGVSLLGVVSTYGTPTRYRFEWGRTKAYGRRAWIGEDNYAYNLDEPVEVEGLTSRLQADTTYHFRLVAWNESGKSFGKDLAFHTPGR